MTTEGSTWTNLESVTGAGTEMVTTRGQEPWAEVRAVIGTVPFFTVWDLKGGDRLEVKRACGNAIPTHPRARVRIVSRWYCIVAKDMGL